MTAQSSPEMAVISPSERRTPKAQWGQAIGPGSNHIEALKLGHNLIRPLWPLLGLQAALPA
jgi:hypothetical protein